MNSKYYINYLPNIFFFISEIQSKRIYKIPYSESSNFKLQCFYTNIHKTSKPLIAINQSLLSTNLAEIKT